MKIGILGFYDTNGSHGLVGKAAGMDNQWKLIFYYCLWCILLYIHCCMNDKLSRTMLDQSKKSKAQLCPLNGRNSLGAGRFRFWTGVAFWVEVGRPCVHKGWEVL